MTFWKTVGAVLTANVIWLSMALMFYAVVILSVR